MYNSDVHFDDAIEEWVGVDLEGIEHFGGTAEMCRGRISEANRAIAAHRQKSQFDNALVSPVINQTRCGGVYCADCELNYNRWDGHNAFLDSEGERSPLDDYLDDKRDFSVPAIM